MSEHLQWASKNVLVTGGAGFIGSHLVEQLIAAGANVTVVDNLSSGSRDNLCATSGNWRLLVADIRQIDWDPVLRAGDYATIFHLAANAYVPPSVDKPDWDCSINFHGTFRLLEVMRNLKWSGSFIYASSAAVYGEPARMPICEDDPTVPISPYGVGKLAAERYVSVYSRLYGLTAASLRFFSVYGPRQQKQVVYDLIKKIQRNPNEVLIHGDGSQVRDFNYVEDAAHALMLVAERGLLAGEVYNTASGQECTIQALAEAIAEVMQVTPNFVYTGSNRPGDPEKWIADIYKLKQLGYRPIMLLKDGIARIVQWLLAEHMHNQ